MAVARDALAAARLIALMLGAMVVLCVLGSAFGPPPPQVAPAAVAALADFSNDTVQAERPARRHPSASLLAGIGTEAEPESSRSGKPAPPVTAASLPAVALASAALPRLRVGTRFLRAPRSHLSQAPPAQA